MCSIVYVGVTGYRGDAMQPFREYGFETAPLSNPACAVLPGTVRFEVKAGGCSCAIYMGAQSDESKDLDPQRRKYERKGWSAAKIERALASATRSHTTPQIDSRDCVAQFMNAIETLVDGGGKVSLLAHFFRGSFSEPFSIEGSARVGLEDYLKSRNRFPENSLVSIQPSA